MATATVTSKGRVTIPVEVRDRLGIRPGTRLEFVATDSGGFEIHPTLGSVKELKGVVPPLPQPVSVEEMDEGIAARATDLGR